MTTSMQKVPTAREPRVPRRAARHQLLAACVGAAGFLVQMAHATEPAPPTMLRAVVPDYPAQARRHGLEGTVHVGVRVLADGQPSDARIHRSSGVRELDQAALAAVTASKFRPAQNAEGVPVEARVIVPYKFLLEDEPKHEATRPPVLHSAPEAP